MHKSFIEKQQIVKDMFAGCTDVDAKYQKIIALGKTQVPLNSEAKCEKNRVKGCQSILYLDIQVKDGKMYFQTESEALISSGLALLLTQVYSGEDAQTVLRNTPKYIEEIGIAQSLTPGRANGLASMYLHMRQEALKLLIQDKEASCEIGQ